MSHVEYCWYKVNQAHQNGTLPNFDPENAHEFILEEMRIGNHVDKLKVYRQKMKSKVDELLPQEKELLIKYRKELDWRVKTVISAEKQLAKINNKDIVLSNSDYSSDEEIEIIRVLIV